MPAVLRRVGQVSLVVKFGVISAVLVVGLGIVLGAVLKSEVEHRALAQAERSAVTIGRMAVIPYVEAGDFRSGHIPPERIGRLQAALRATDSQGEVLRVKVYDVRGTLLYSDESELIGQRIPSEGLDAATAGRTYSEIEAEAHDSTESSLGTVLEVYVPIRSGTAADGSRPIVGVFEMYLPYTPIAQGVAADLRDLSLWLAGGLLALWAGLFRLVVAASRRLRQHTEESRWLAQHDALTGLPNRTLFTDRVSQALRFARRSGAAAAVLLLDLDRFKEVNDTLGHHTGDALISAVADRLSGALREVDTVSRLGGDEFAVLLPELSDADAAEQVARELLATLRHPFAVDGLTLEIDASIGVAGYPVHARDVGTLLQRADVAMYQAKQNHDGVVVYQHEFDVHTPARLALFGELRRAIEEHQLLLHYQPKVDLSAGAVCGVEALVRWQHPRRGLLHPDEFISVAEQTGLIRPMTLCVLEMALRDCRRWRDDGLDLSVAVNLSARGLLDSQLPVEVENLLGRYGLPPSALEVEITETTAMVDPGRALRVLSHLRDLGVRLSVDDYGTGHASLAYLQKLPVDTLKIDKSFVRSMHANPHEATIVRSTIDLARNLGLHVVAEGVESEAAWRQLGVLGCDAAQGYWLARPGSADDIPQTISTLQQRLVASAAAPETAA